MKTAFDRWVDARKRGMADARVHDLSQARPGEISVTYSTTDRLRRTRKFKSLKGAQGFAQKWVGKRPEISEGFGYAISGDGVGKITCSGCAITDLFPELQPKAPEPQQEFDYE